MIGEFLCIYSEMIAAHATQAGSSGLWKHFYRNLFVYALSGIFLIGGYILAYRAFKNIWVVTVISVTSILILEPVLAYAIFREAPTTGAKVGLILGGLGLIATLF